MVQTKPQVVRHRLENDYGTPVKSVKETDTEGRWKVTVEIEGGYSFAFGPTDQYRLDHLVGSSSSETFTMYIVEKR